MGIQINGNTDNISATDGGLSVSGFELNQTGVSTFHSHLHVADQIIHLGDANSKIRFPAADTITAETAGSERLRIKSDGKIGINTVSPTYGMHLHGTTASSNAYYYAEQSTAGASAGFRLKTTGSHFSIYGATSGSALGIYDYNASAERVTITSGGNILVGTSVDSNNKVTLYGNNASILMQNAATGTGSGNGFYLGNGNGTLSYVWNYENDAIQFATNNTERLRITNNGQLNTYTTGTVTADFNTSNGAGSYLQFDTGASGANIGYIGAGSQLVTGSSTNDLGFRSANHMVFSTGGSVERFRINSNGQIYCTTSTTISLDLNTTSSSGAYLQFDTGVSGTNIGYMGAGSQLVTGTATNDLGIRSTANLVFSTGGSTERFRIDSGSGMITLGNSTNTTLKAEINNSVGGHYFVSQCDDNQNGFEIYQQHGATNTRAPFAVYDNKTGSKDLSFKIDGAGWTYHNTTYNDTTNGSVDKRYNIGSTNNANVAFQLTTRQRYSIWEHRQIGRSQPRTAQISCGENNDRGIVYVYSSTANADVTGGVNLYNGATSWSGNSDMRLKNKTGDILNALEDINKIEPLRFTWKYGPDNNPHVGVSAQSVENVVPEAIDRGVDVERQREGDETEYMKVRYTELIPLSIAAIKELKSEVESLKAEIASLKSS